MKLLKSCCLVGALTVLSVYGQEIPRVAFDVGGGFTQARGALGSRTDSGWNIGAGVGYNFSSYFALMGQFGFNTLGINGQTLTNLGYPNGTVHVASFTAEPVVHLVPRSPVDIYLVGGGGLYRVQREFTQPAVAPTVGFDPWFGFYQGYVGVNQVLSSYSVNKPGWNAGLGFAVGTKWHGKVFAEARYTRVHIGNDRYLDYVPVSFGFRF